MDSPYLSLISLVKGWPQQNVRREVLMLTDGIDRLRGEKPAPSRLGPDYGPVYHSMPTMSVDATSASEISQRYNVIVYSLYAVGVGRAGRSSWDLQLGLGVCAPAQGLCGHAPAPCGETGGEAGRFVRHPSGRPIGSAPPRLHAGFVRAISPWTW
jgi:hypothetical protein